MDIRSTLTRIKTLLESKTVRWGVYLLASSLLRGVTISAEDIDLVATQAGVILQAVWTLLDVYAAKRVITNRANAQKLLVGGEWREMGDIPLPYNGSLEEKTTALEKVVVQRIEGKTSYPEQDIPAPKFSSKEEREQEFQKWINRDKTL